MAAVYKGHKGFVNDAYPYVADYLARKRLAGLGYITPLDQLDCQTADIFLLIDVTLQKLEEAEAKKKHGR